MWGGRNILERGVGDKLAGVSGVKGVRSKRISLERINIVADDFMEISWLGQMAKK